MDSDQNAASEIDSRSLLNARLALTEIPVGDAGSLEVALWGQNLTDERYIAGGQFTTDVLGTEAGIYNAPRMYGVDLGAKF